MGKVYAGRNLRIGRRVAIKFLLPQYAAYPDVLRRFENEARAAGPIQHENVAAVHDFGQDQGTPFLVMDLLEGEDCAQLLRRAGPLPVARAVDLVVQVCRGLDVAHRAGIVHRDLKPANLFVTKRAERTDLVKILDFGIAKLRSDSGVEKNTGTGVALGTPHYMSPEQARGERNVDARTDVYALGVILYELLTGRTPHTGSSYLEIIYSILHSEPTPIDTLRPGLPAGLSTVVATAMSMDRTARYATVEALGEALLPFAEGRVPALRAEPVGVVTGAVAPTLVSAAADPAAPMTPSPPVTQGARFPQPRVWLVLTVTFVGLFGAAAWWIRTRPARLDARIEMAPPVAPGDAPAVSAPMQAGLATAAPVVTLAPPSSGRTRPDTADTGAHGPGTAPSAIPTSRRAVPPSPKGREVPAAMGSPPASHSHAGAASSGKVDISRDPNF
jgi:serine/threonine-protein kinase